MKIEHIALWCADLEAMKDFYVRYFGGAAGEKYTNEKKGFSSYFLSFGADSTRLELMHSIRTIPPVTTAIAKGRLISLFPPAAAVRWTSLPHSLKTTAFPSCHTPGQQATDTTKAPSRTPKAMRWK